MKRIVLALFVLTATVALAVSALRPPGTEVTPLQKLAAKRARDRSTTHPAADHSRFTQLQAKFDKPQAVTAACISCHNERHLEVMRSSHWNWERTEYVPGQGIRAIGKRNILNNFCIGISGSEQSCNRCHVGYGYGDASFDFTNPLNVDCLVCHDNSGKYVKAAGAAGMPDPSVNLSEVAQHVGRPQRTNCGTCHFFGGGGNNVKHGDLESALFDAPRTVDVHMGTDGPNMDCVECHTAKQHQMLGKMYSVSSMNRNRVACEQCHSEFPHADDTLNRHTAKVACQTCHIPTYAKVNPTKMSWDWSTAGRLKDGKPYEERDASGKADAYMSIKGSFVWATDVRPEYAWFDGTASHYLLGDRFDPATPLVMNPLHGSYDDPDAKIVPVKVHRGKQIYDVEHRYLVQPKLYSAHQGDGGYWAEFNWTRASEEGMKLVGLPFSGKYAFARTEMNWPINHMVAPKEQAVGCNECHTRSGGRLARVGGFYLPGRDYSPWVDWLGTGLLAVTLVGVGVHGGARLVLRRTRKGQR